jgi:hypothetical protein
VGYLKAYMIVMMHNIINPSPHNVVPTDKQNVSKDLYMSDPEGEEDEE